MIVFVFNDNNPQYLQTLCFQKDFQEKSLTFLNFLPCFLFFSMPILSLIFLVKAYRSVVLNQIFKKVFRLPIRMKFLSTPFLFSFPSACFLYCLPLLPPSLSFSSSHPPSFPLFFLPSNFLPSSVPSISFPSFAFLNFSFPLSYLPSSPKFHLSFFSVSLPPSLLSSFFPSSPLYPFLPPFFLLLSFLLFFPALLSHSLYPILPSSSLNLSFTPLH